MNCDSKFVGLKSKFPGQMIQKLWEGAKEINMYFREQLLNVWHTTYNFLRLYAYLYDLKPTTARMLLGPEINAARERAN